MSALDDRKARVLAAAVDAPSPTRGEVQRRDRALLAVVVVAAALLFAAIGGVQVGSRPPALIVASGVAWSVVAAAATSLALRRGRAMLGAPRAVLLGGALAVAPVLAVTWWCLPFRDGAMPLYVPHSYERDAVCFAITIALAAGPLFVFLRLREDGDPVRPTVTGAALGAAAGAWGATLIDLHCERTDLLHVLLGHVAPVVLLSIVGAVLAARSGRVVGGEK